MPARSPRATQAARHLGPFVYVEPTWEYKHLVRDLAKEAAPDEPELNALGAEGWELAGVLAHGSEARF